MTHLLQQWRQGDKAALDELMPLVYAELRRLASISLRNERPGHTLQTTALVNEAYIKLVGHKIDWQNRGHFFAVASQAIRRILVDYARTQRRQKRGGGVVPLQLDEALDVPEGKTMELIALDDALTELSAIDEQQAKVVELRFFAGLSIEETAEVLEVSRATVNRDWVTARAWLIRELEKK